MSLTVDACADGGTATIDHEPFTFEGMTHDVYEIGSGPAVILMHELPGLGPGVFELGQHIADLGYSVLMPKFYGAVGQTSVLKGFAQICVSREFRVLRTNRTSRITRWLRGLAADRNDGRGVAAIGMCATGGLVLGLLLEPSVVAGVASQPSLPFAWRGCGTARKANLGMSPEEVAEVAELGKPLLALRFAHDRTCPAERVEAMKEVLGATTREVPPGGDYDAAVPPIPEKAHSVLTYHHVWLEGHPSHDAFLGVMDFLTAHLPPEVEAG